MKRRQFIFGAGTLVLAASTRAQAPRRYRLGILEVFERYARTEEELTRIARELAAIPVDVILTEGTGQTFIVLNATKVIPIVTTVGDAVGSGFARTLKNPGGNVTGMSQNRARLVTKVIELLRLMRPGITEVGVLGEQPKGLALAGTSVDGIRLRPKRQPSPSVIGLPSSVPGDSSRRLTRKRRPRSASSSHRRCSCGSIASSNDAPMM